MDVIDSLEAAIAAVEEARSVPLSASCVVNRSEMLKLLDSIKVAFPNDLAKAISILRRQEEILEDANQQSVSIIEQAPNSSGAQNYRNLAWELVARLETQGSVAK
jgi:nitrogenase subunit NifH